MHVFQESWRSCSGPGTSASGRYSHAIVTGGDILSEFVISGFQSFQSLSPVPCKPYDAARNGLSLGEGMRDHGAAPT